MVRSPAWLWFTVLVVIFSSKVLAGAQKQSGKPKLLKQSVVDEVNSKADAGWVAALHPHMAHYEEDAFAALLGLKPRKPEFMEPRASVQEDTDGDFSAPQTSNFPIPKNFNLVTAHPQCSNIIGKIRDQGHCGACWAFAVSGSLQDRICMQLNQTVLLSPNDLLACCDSCSENCNQGGDVMEAWSYITANGIHTEECYPYFDQKGCPYGGCNSMDGKPTCAATCEDASHQSWEDDSTKFWAAPYDIYDFTATPDETIMREIYQYGSIAVTIDVYEDLFAYRSGVYQHVTGRQIGGHVLRLIGWGTTNDGVDYWIAANTWNVQWGEKGFARIKRGNSGNGMENSWYSFANPSLTQVTN